MDLATVLSVVQTILTAIQTLDQLKATFSLYQYKGELQRLEKTVGIVESVLVDADAKQGALSTQQRIYIEELKDAIYDVNDVLDEFITLVKQRKVVFETRHKLSNKVRSFISRFSLRIHHNLPRKVKDVNKKLNDIASTSSKFLFKVDNKPIRFEKREAETYSFVAGGDDKIVGRDEDLEKVVRMLLDSDNVDQPNNVSCLAIVGMGGLGKTRFAQLVYNDPRVTNAFQLKCWACVADYQGQWNLTEVLSKIVNALPITNLDHLTSARQMSLQIMEQLGGKKYLFVLDDVWTESYDKWRAIENILRVGACGSRIVVTTRSKETAKIIGGVRVHELQGLLEVESWRLFESIAFAPYQLENLDDDFVKLGKEIVSKCSNVPLVIRVVATLFYGQAKDKWLSYRDKNLANILGSKNLAIINNVLSLSYYQLDSPLKSCFSYFAIFPKDFVIDKDMLISLWMAQGYISTEYLGQEYFLTFLHRCFFKDIEEDEWGEIKRFKIHDLFHDIAEQQAARDICRLSSDSLIVHNKVRHLSLFGGFCSQGTIDKTQVTRIRTCVQVHSSSDPLLAGISLANWTCLRSLDLRKLDIETLPESISKLFHLRWLNLSWCERLNKLCDSITKLVNLQTLDLSNCSSLRELPREVSKLLDLSTLNLTNCKRLSHMPSGIGSLTHLHTLGLFVVGQKSLEWKQCFEELEVLRSMSNLKGFLEVRIGVRDIANFVKEDHGGGYLINKERLSVIQFTFTGRERQNLHHKQDIAYKNIACEQSLLEETLQPHRDLKGLLLEGYNGEILPKWLRREDNPVLFHLRSLVSLRISDCVMLQCLSTLEELPHLKVLKLKNLPSVEYVLNVKPEALDLDEGLSLFPCLEELDIRDLPKLKGWWPRSGSVVQNTHLLISVPVPCFVQLKILSIVDCPILQSFPMCSSLERVSVESQPNSTMVLDSKDEFHRFIKTFMSSDSKSRIVSLVGSESETESSNIDTELTTVIHSWMSRHGYTFSAI